MSLIGNISGTPLFSTIREALAWAAANGLSGYHSHSLDGQVGYMGGANHQQATGISTTTSTPSTPSGSSGGGGY